MKWLVGRWILSSTQAFEINALMIEGAQSCSLLFVAEGGEKRVHRFKKKKRKGKNKCLDRSLEDIRWGFLPYS